MVRQARTSWLIMRKLPEHQAISLGTVARDAVAGGGDGEIIAVFDRSFYVLAARGIFSVCMAELGRGPINILVAGTVPPWAGLVRLEMKATLSAERLLVHSGFALTLTGADIWTPPPSPLWSSAAVARGLKCVRDLAQPRAPNDGIAALVLAPNRADHTTMTALAAKPLLDVLRAEVPFALRDGAWTGAAARAAILLVGLGPGLTPSGDDYLGGLMLALIARGRTDLCDGLWELLVDELNDLTVPVSAMHLSAAAGGMAAEAMHQMLNTILVGDAAAITASLDAVARIGSTSGWDALAGLVVGLETESAP
jgi:Protein of unknown function (DUF2877)